MANTIGYTKLWDPVQIGITETEIYTRDTGTSALVVKNISANICNTTAAGITVEIWIVPDPGTTTGDSNRFISNRNIPGNGNLAITLGDMAKDDAIIAKASGAGLTMHCTSGVIFNG